MSQANGKVWGHYKENATTNAFLDELSAALGIPRGELVQSKIGEEQKGTWVHEQVAIHLAQWCSPRFAVMGAGWIVELLTTCRVTVSRSFSA